MTRTHMPLVVAPFFNVSLIRPKRDLPPPPVDDRLTRQGIAMLDVAAQLSRYLS